MELFLIDATGPFFRNYERKRVNWSKIPFTHLDTATDEDWAAMETELEEFAWRVARQGYNAVSLDDLAHLAPHPLHEPEIAQRILAMRARFTRFFNLLRNRHGLRVYLTSDVLPLTPAIEAAIGGDHQALEDYYHQLVCGVLDDFPQLSGLILRVGESDGNDVCDSIRTRLFLRNAAQANRLLARLLPEFERRGRELIFRTWTVGAHRIGDLIWHRDTLDRALAGLDSPNLIVSMKHGESDFFRQLPLNKSFYRVRQRKLLELQARREYEGAGEYPSFIGWECERFVQELAGVENMAGVSVWCQTGGWHRFRRRAFLEKDGRDVWIRLNTAAAIAVFRHRHGVRLAVESIVGRTNTDTVLELLEHADVVIRDLLYIDAFARQKLYFRRVRVPPLIHVYWDSLFINDAVRGLMRNFVSDSARQLQDGESAAARFPRMIELAREAGLPSVDIEHMRDFCQLLLLARRYYFLPFKEERAAEIEIAKKAYKQSWPRGMRARYRVKVSFTPFPLKRRTIAFAARLLLRRQRGYRFIDRIFTLYLMGIAYRTFKPRDPKAVPKFLRKSAMGVETLLK